MPGGRLELPRGCPRWILSPLRLPFRHPGKTLSILSISHELVKDTQTQVKKRAPGKPFEKTAKTALSLRRRTAGHRLRGAKGAGTFEQFLSIVRLNISDGSAVEEPEFLRGQPDGPLPFFPPEDSGADNSLEKADQSADNSAAALGKEGLRGQRIVGNGHRPGDGMCVVAPSVPNAGTPSVTRPRYKGREALRDFDENAAPAGAWKLYAKGVQTATPFTTLTLPST